MEGCISKMDAEDYEKRKYSPRFLHGRYKKRVLLQARESLSYESTVENKCLPRGSVPVTLKNGMELPSRLAMRPMVP